MRRVGEEFIPVALKAGKVAGPPDNVEGRLYRHLRRTQPAPQGICAVNSDGRVIAWALMFDDDKSVLAFLDHVKGLFGKTASATERYMKFPSHRLEDVKDEEVKSPDDPRHKEGERCFATPGYPEGTLVGRVIGRTFKDGKSLGDPRRQEHYAEDRFEVSVATQEALSKASGSFELPDDLVRTLVGSAFLGMLDVNPLGAPGGKNDRRAWKFTGRRDRDLIRFEGTSEVAGGEADEGRRSDGRRWEHRVKLSWTGFIEIKEKRVVRLLAWATGSERLKWGNARMIRDGESDVAHLPGGRPIDLEAEVRYGLIAVPVSRDEIGPGDRQESIQRKMKRLQELVQGGQDPARAEKHLKKFEKLMRDGEFAEAELDAAIKTLED